MKLNSETSSSTTKRRGNVGTTGRLAAKHQQN